LSLIFPILPHQLQEPNECSLVSDSFGRLDQIVGHYHLQIIAGNGSATAVVSIAG
jgi:hypothetical protein